MNKKELTILATQEAKMYERLKYHKRSTYHYYKLAVRYRKEGDVYQAKRFWRYTKDAYIEAEKAFSFWDALFNLKNQLKLPIEKYAQAVDKEVLATEQWFYNNAYKDDKKEVKWSFLWAIKKTIF